MKDRSKTHDNYTVLLLHIDVMNKFLILMSQTFGFFFCCLFRLCQPTDTIPKYSVVLERTIQMKWNLLEIESITSNNKKVVYEIIEIIQTFRLQLEKHFCILSDIIL